MLSDKITVALTLCMLEVAQPAVRYCVQLIVPSQLGEAPEQCAAPLCST